MWRRSVGLPPAGVLSSRLSTEARSTSSIRKTFLDYFSRDHGHVLVPSSSLIPHNDPSLHFVNAGMNEFKDVFLGTQKPPSSRVTNVQKCVRINDLSAVGRDGTHHTFFEMLGSWSFGDYSKSKACSLAWNLLTGPYQMDPRRLYVTYFNGCPEKNLAPDLETQEVWLSLGIPPDHILPFGAEDNFWSMGPVGPCGPCTEIHYDHAGRGPEAVNRGTSDAVEVWNLVFMTHSRDWTGSLTPLPKMHVDTGMGLERLTAVLNGQTSNYNTDAFAPLFRKIAARTGRPPYEDRFGPTPDLNSAYRILADHSRMIVACLTDGLYPDSSHRLRHVIRRSLRTAKEFFDADHKLLTDLSEPVCESLRGSYPEVDLNLERVEVVLDFEADSYELHLEKGNKILPSLVTKYPGLSQLDPFDAPVIANALNYLENRSSSAKDGEISGETALYLHTTLGVQPDQMRTLAEVKGLKFEYEAFERAFAREKSKTLSSRSLGSAVEIPDTNDSYKYQYSSPTHGHYRLPMVPAEVIKIFDSAGNSVERLEEGQQGSVHLNRTVFYAEAGGQVGDIGTLVSDSDDGAAIFKVTDCQEVSKTQLGKIAHIGSMVKGDLSLKSEVQVRLDVAHRLAVMQSHTGAHLLHEAMNSFLPLTAQRSSHIGPDQFTFDFSIFQSKLDLPTIADIEERVNKRIASNLPIGHETVRPEDLAKKVYVVTKAGTRFPVDQVVRLVNLPTGQTETCCGTHAFNTGDVQAFAIIDVNTPCHGVRSFKCLTGKKAVEARTTGIDLLEEVLGIDERFFTTSVEQNLSALMKAIRTLKKSVLPFTIRTEMTRLLDDLLQQARSEDKKQGKKVLADEIQFILEDSDLPYVVKTFSHDGSTFFPSKITKHCKDRPILVICNFQGIVRAQAVVPDHLVTDHFDAESWINCVAEKFDTTGKAPSGKDSRLVCNFSVTKPKSSKEKETIKDRFESLISESEKTAKEFVSRKLNY